MEATTEKRRPRTKTIVALIAGGIAILALTVAGMGFAMNMRGFQAADAEGVVTETVETGDIVQTVSGAGSLAPDKPMSVLVPAGLVVDKVLVKQGDTVEVGTPIATVTQSSVRQKLLDMEEDIDSLQKQLDGLSAGSAHYDLKRSVLQDQIANVKGDRDAMLHLQETLTLQSDTRGTVGSVSLFEGTPTGQASLKDSKSAEEDAKGKSEEESPDAPEFSPAAFSPDDGGHATVAAYKPAGAPRAATAAMPVKTLAGQVNLVLAEDGAGETLNEAGAASGQEANEGDVAPAPVPGAGDAQVPVPDAGEAQGADGAANDPDVPGTQFAPAAPIEVYGRITLAVTPPATGAQPQRDPGIAEEVDEYTGTIEWVPEDRTFAAQTDYAAIVYLTAADGLCFSREDSAIDVSVPGAVAIEKQLKDLDADGHPETLKVVVAFPTTGATIEAEAGIEREAGELDGFDDGGFSLGGGFDMGGYESDATSLTKAGSSRSDTEAVAITVIPGNKMYLDIQVDELDVMRIDLGQKAQVSLDALDGETFEATIAQIADSAQGSAHEGGSAKYTVRMEMPRDERMRYGMSAKAKIVVSEVKGAVLVPIDALSEIDGKSVVFTAVDENGVLQSPTVVTTGLSDGSQVEVTEGLSSGDTICYVPSVEGDDESYY